MDNVQKHSMQVYEECLVCESSEDHINMEVCCDMESTSILDQYEEQFCPQKEVSVFSSQTSL
jgi:hypothetical protein